MSLYDCPSPIKTRQCKRSSYNRLRDQLVARRAEINLLTFQLENGRNSPRRRLLDQRLDSLQARAADVFARLIEARAAA